MIENQEVMNRIEETNVANVSDTPKSIFDGSGISADDLAIDRLQLMQGLSDAVADGTAKMGDIWHTGEGRVIGGFDKGVPLLVLAPYKTLLVEEIVQGTKKFLRQEPINSQNSKLWGEALENGKPVIYSPCLNFFCLLADDLEAFPLVVRFKSTSMDAGKKINTHIYTMEELKRPIYSQVMELGSEKKKNDKGTFAVYTVKKLRAATPDEMQIAGSRTGLIEKLREKVLALRDEPETSQTAKPPTVVSADPSDTTVGF